MALRLGKFAFVALGGAGGLLVGSLYLAAAASEGRGGPRAAEPRQAVLVAIPGGRVQIGDDRAPPDERPQFIYEARPLLMDRTPVTVAQFRRFVQDTGYRTDAERYGTASVFDPRIGGWLEVEGADWRRPEGPSGAAAADDHPVTQVSWRDADAFCRAYGARLPTEFEWERAARLGQTPEGHVFKLGDSLKGGGRYLANVWQGPFPLHNSNEDGFRTTAPVGAFGEAPSGLTDMAGNVWEWTASWYRPYDAAKPADRGIGERVQRGGSFLCDPTFCQGFRATARAHATPESALMHVGFRCVVEPSKFTARAGRLAQRRT
ncbi:MAG: formylglycine-generating enzyme family protein [Phenylobacterium sp.]|uniref:formylglycine-generating enzyme family protein n=1 Tax=Phenylobacterium sp. TaxID=1871053 RepID=UPI001A5E8CE4|nr:formylglycine-generating enzyme family protein [Phenylobacterium sp.]MBL8769927.1 formylglycine-generating enzyme family protein [Phenylobacterium sp.]